MPGLASLACYEHALAQGYVPAQPRRLPAERTVDGVPAPVSLVVLGQPAAQAR
ncbi:MAG: hypothetical protein WAO95_03645 [Burkholderiales bacterium]